MDAISVTLGKRQPMPDVGITPLEPAPSVRLDLARLLVETVAAGGSVGFMDPLPIEDALAFWDGALAAAERGERVLLGAWDGETLVATVTLLLAFPPNQPHRAEIAKMMTQPSHRGRGIAARLLAEAEAIAIARGKTHLLLDTAADGGAAGLYERAGFRLVGEIPDFALKPQGGLTGTLVYWKPIGAAVTAASTSPR